MTIPVRVDATGWGWRHVARRRWAVRDLDLRIEPGERVLLLGASGSGKSTLLAGLAGVLGGDDEGESTGSLLLDGRPPAQQRGRAGLVLQQPDTQLVMSQVGDDVAFACENIGVPRDEIWVRVHEALEMVGLQVPLQTPTSHLSGGQKQRLALAGMLAMRPGLLLLDEPTANLDPEGVTEIRDAVARVLQRSPATLVVVEHRVAVWRDLVDRVVVLDAAGGILADGHPDDVLVQAAEPLRNAGVWVDSPGQSTAVQAPRGTTRGAPVLSADALTVGRRVAFARRPTAVAAGISLDLHAASMLAITGRNGSGKSTLALTVAGLLDPVAGSVRAAPALADGAHVEPGRWSSRQLLTRIGFVFQEPEHQFLTGRVRDEIAVGLSALARPAAEIRARQQELLARLRLEHLAGANPFTLSGGEKRRLSVATALATAPRVIVLDEPTFGQDARTWRELVALFTELTEAGSAIVLVTHDLDLIAAVGADEFSLVQRAGERDAADAGASV